jgi:hypothetical protein
LNLYGHYFHAGGRAQATISSKAFPTDKPLTGETQGRGLGARDRNDVTRRTVRGRRSISGNEVSGEHSEYRCAWRMGVRSLAVGRNVVLTLRGRTRTGRAIKWIVAAEGVFRHTCALMMGNPLRAIARNRDIEGARKVQKTLENKAFLQIALGVIYERRPECLRLTRNGVRHSRDQPEMGTNLTVSCPCLTDQWRAEKDLEAVLVFFTGGLDKKYLESIFAGAKP